MEVGELFVTATHVRVVGDVRHFAAMLFTPSMIGHLLKRHGC